MLSLLAGRPLFTSARRGTEEAETPEAGSSFRTCPICGSLLKKGERVKSVVFAGGVKAGTITEKSSHLFGCPHCYPANGKNPRLCPVCKKTIPADGYLIARMFENPAKPRKHVHVLGCTACRQGKR